MKNDKLDQYIETLLDDLLSDNLINSGDIPRIDLYMDQVLSYVDENIGIYKRNPEDKILTKTMINNYSKSHLLPPSNKKKYSKQHIILLVMIYSLKQTLSISDIKKLLEPLYTITNKNEDVDLAKFFDTVTNTQGDGMNDLRAHILQTIETAEGLFPENEDDSLNTIALAYLLSIKASIYKHISGKIIDEFLTPNTLVPEKKRKNKNSRA